MEQHRLKDRVCWSCKQTLKVTAKGIKEHYELCKSRKKGGEKSAQTCNTI